jgi:uncharacterized protein with NRDE domain
MCLLALFYRVVDDAPLVVGANREEFYNRPADPPRILEGPARAVAGMDRMASGTWLGVNEGGLVVAVTNRPRSQLPPQPRSRGLLARDLLGCRSAREAIDLATRELDQGRYAGCNILCADTERLVVFQAGDWLRIQHLPPGLHVLTNGDINDSRDARLAYVLGSLQQQSCQTAEECLDALRQLCAQRGNGHPPICLHGKARGTVSSTLLVLRSPLRKSTYLHAQGPPDRTPYQDYSHLLQEIAR